MGLLDSLIGGVGDVISGVVQSNAAGNAAKALKKAGKKQLQTSQEGLQYAKDIYGKQQAQNEALLPQQQNAITSGLASQVGALNKAQAQQTATLQGAQGQTQGYFNPYVQYGLGSLGALNGVTGQNPQDAAAILAAFHNSPLYQAVYQNAIDNANRALGSQYGAAGQYNSGARLKALQDRAASITSQLFGQYLDQINKGVGVGQTSVGQLTPQLGQLAQSLSSAYGNTGERLSSAYGTAGVNQAANINNMLNRGVDLTGGLANAAATGYGNIYNAQGNIGQAKAAGYTYPAMYLGQGLQGAANQFGKAAGNINTSGFENMLFPA